MDDFVDCFLSSASWSELHTSSRLSWSGDIASQTNELHANSVEAYESEKKNPLKGMIPKTQMVENVVSKDLQIDAHSDTSSVYNDETLKYMSPPELSTLPSQATLHDNETHGNNFLMKGIFESNLRMQESTLNVSNSIESNDNGHSAFPFYLEHIQSISSVSTMWAPLDSGGSSFMEQGKLQGFGFQGAGSNDDVLGKSFTETGKYHHLHNSPAISLHDHSEFQTSHLPSLSRGQQMKLTSTELSDQQEQNSLPNLQLPSFSTGPQMTLSKPPVVQASRQLSQSNLSPGAQYQEVTANVGACENRAAKPRVRARRGQATDPHSIAERLRRGKIAERMRNLQELIPNSNMTDKASMLDEIIDYVKFLRLQVKVLSMSRLGAAGAVDVQSEGSNILHLSSTGQGAANVSETEGDAAFEQEVAKMMESNITAAMQYLQNEGLCLMPIALASAISSQKGSFAAILPDQRKSEANHSTISRSDGQSFAARNIGGSSGGVKQEFLKSI